ncbi:MAG: helix-turn-helix domain-containing protein [Chitinophagales bacterium]
METTELQQKLFTHLKQTLPPHLSLVDELCDLLELGSDSVYRRIRGEKPVTLAELKKLCEHYHVSIDQLLHLQNESAFFDAPGINNVPENFSDYLKEILVKFRHFNTYKNTRIQYFCKDIPIWYVYLFPELAAFKTFFWSKTFYHIPELNNKKFSLKEYPYYECFLIGQQILEEQNRIPSVELWNLESINSTLNQITYYREIGNFTSNDDFFAVIDSFQQTLDHLQMQAEHGVKFMPGSTDLSYKASVHFYLNDLIMGNDTMLLSLDDKKLSMITYGVFNYLLSSDPRFLVKITAMFDTLFSRSTLVSKTDEKARSRFFNILREKVKALKTK